MLSLDLILSADTFSSFSIFFHIPEIFPETINWLHYNTLSQNIYQPTRDVAKLAAHAPNLPYIRESRLSLLENWLLSGCKRFVAPSPETKYFILMDIFWLQASLNLLLPAPKAHIRKELAPFITSEKDVKYASWQLNSSKETGFVTLYNSSFRLLCYL